MLKGSLKDKLIAIAFLLIAIGIASYIYIDARNTKKVVEIPVINTTLNPGDKIEQKHIDLEEIGQYKLNREIIDKEENIVGKYAIKHIYKGRYVYKSDIDDNKPPVETKDKIKFGAIAVTTDLTKCVGGLPDSGDFVKVNIVRKNNKDRGRLDIVQYPELEKVKILEIKNTYGEEIKKEEDKKSSGIGASTERKPAQVIFDATNLQQKKLLQGEYEGEIHLVLIPLNQMPRENEAKFDESKSKEKEKNNIAAEEPESIDNVENKDDEIKTRVNPLVNNNTPGNQEIKIEVEETE